MSRGHMMPPLQHVRDNGTGIGTTGHSENVIASTVCSLWRHKMTQISK